MVTCSKSGISKKKIFLTTKHPHATPIHEYYDYITKASKSESWSFAMSKEFSALQHQGTWSLVPRQSGQNIVGCLWVYKLKHDADGTIAHYKACLVAKGFH